MAVTWAIPDASCKRYTTTCINLAELAAKAPEAAILAASVVAENKKFEQDRSQLLRMDKWERRDAMIAFFGREIEEVFTFKELAGYLDMTEQYYNKLKRKALLRKANSSQFEFFFSFLFTTFGCWEIFNNIG